MASASTEKRRRTLEDDGDEEVVDIQTASSRLSREALHKRQRVSNIQNGERSTVEHDSDADLLETLEPNLNDDDDDEDRRVRDDSVHYEAMRDADDAEDDEQRDRRNQTQLIERRLRDFKENHAADNAIIEEIECTNFMCHARLNLKLGPLINFIIGHNGSGKSAALTALQLCLGGRATNTNRGQKLSDFIKHGEDNCILSVRIKNQGISAYKPQEYGPSIVVERHFNRQGVSNFKLKNSQGKIISTKKGDLEDITDAFALQLDNPMMCLTQDQAREFLNNSGPREKYKFFFRGTQLETLDNDYQLMSEKLDELETRLYALSEDQRTAKAAFRRATEIYNESKKDKNMEQEFERLRRQMAWIQVQEQEEKVAGIDAQIAQAREGVNEATQNFEAVSDEYDRAHEIVEALREALQELKESVRPHATERDAVKDEWDERTKQVKELHVQERQIKDTMKTSKKQLTNLEAAIEAEEQRIRDANGGAHAERLAEYQAAREEAERLTEELHGFGPTFRDLDREKLKTEEADEEAKQNTRQAREALQAGQRTLRELENSRGQWLRAYEDGKGTMKKVLNAIEAEERFREKPVGPCGRHVRILKPEWTSIIESSFGQTLSAFCVTSPGDAKLLSDLMRRVGAHYTVFISHGRNALDTHGKEPDPELLTWYRVLEFDNDLVRNQAIINHSIEQTVLIKDLEQATKFMDVRNHNGQRPHNVKRTFALNQDPRRGGHSLGITSSGGGSMGPVHPYNRPSRMNTDDEYQIREAQEQLQTLNAQLKEADTDRLQCEQEFIRAKQAIVRKQREHRDTKLRQEEAQDRADKIQDDLEAAVNRPDKLHGLQDQLQQTRAELQNAENQYTDCHEEKESMGEKQQELKAKLDEISLRMQDLSAEEGKMDVKLKKRAGVRENALRKKNEADARIRDAEQAVQRLQVQRDKEQDSLEREFITGATTVCPRVPIDPGMTGKKCDKMLADLDRKLKVSRSKNGGDTDQLRRRALARKTDLKAAAAVYEDTRNLSGTLKMALRERVDRWRKFRRLISSRAKTQFMFLLSERKFRGQLKLKHDEKLLEIQVEPDITRSSDKGRQTKTLSGGEKSFSTICLLLSLWDAMGNPIRCLDEFDVFMDSVNRDVSMKMMIDAARRSVSKQFILISPQSMNSSHMGPDVHIIKMNDPERGQQALPAGFTRQRA